MSAKALDLYRTLREGGMGEDAARKTAEALDARLDEARRESDQAVQNAAEKIRAETVSADEYHQRMEKTPTRAESETEYAKLREEMRAGFADIKRDINRRFERVDRFFVGLAIGLIVLFLKDFIGS